MPRIDAASIGFSAAGGEVPTSIEAMHDQCAPTAGEIARVDHTRAGVSGLLTYVAVGQ